MISFIREHRTALGAILFLAVILLGLVVAFPMIAKFTSSDDQCTVVYQDCCGKNPIAVNKKFTDFFTLTKDYCACPAVVTARDRIDDYSVAENGRCVLKQELDQRCQEQLESLDTDAADELRRFKMSPCGQAAQIMGKIR